MQRNYGNLIQTSIRMKQPGHEDLRIASGQFSFVPPIGATLSNLRPGDRDLTVTEVNIDFEFLNATVWVK